MGPVQVLVVGFERPSFSGEVLAEFERLREAGVVRLVDLLLVVRGEDGTVETVRPPEGATPGLGLVAAALLAADQAEADGAVGAEAKAGGSGDGDASPNGTWSLADSVPPGSAAAVALVEHVWAEPLTSALSRAGGRTLDETWLSAADREELEGLLREQVVGGGAA